MSILDPFLGVPLGSKMENIDNFSTNYDQKLQTCTSMLFHMEDTMVVTLFDKFQYENHIWDTQGSKRGQKLLIVLDFDAAKITTNFVLGEDGVRHPDFKGTMVANNAQYHHNCHIRYTSYKMERKKQSLQKKKKNLTQVAESGRSLRGSTASTSGRASLSADSICIICGKPDDVCNLHAAGALHATKSKSDVDHVTKLTNQWRTMAIFLGDDALRSRLMIGDLGANSSFYHKRCSTKFYNDYRNKQNKQGKCPIDIDAVMHGTKSLLHIRSQEPDLRFTI